MVESVHLGKLLAWLLRHEPEAYGLSLDAAGWVAVDRLLAALKQRGHDITRPALEVEVAGDDKQRFTLSEDGSRIRAAQGHSIAVDLGLAAVTPPARLYHGTPTRFVDAIRREGLIRGKRHHVHLSPDPRTAVSVGRRRGRPVVLEIDAAAMDRDGHRFYRSDNGVWLCDRVPPLYLSTGEAALAPAGFSSNESAVREAEELEIATPTLRVTARAWGPAEGRPLLAMHGWLDNAASFDGLGPLLAAAGMRLISLDLPGHGRSQHKPGTYHFVDWVDDVIAIADALDWSSFSLIGHSMGAGIAVLTAGSFPQRIDRLVLLEGVGPMTEEPEHAATRLARSLRNQARKLGADERKRVYASVDEAAARLAEATAMQPASAAILAARGLQATEDGWRWRADPKLRVDSRLVMTEAHVHAFLRAISCPVLLIRADRGWPYDAARIAARLACVAQLEDVQLSGRHHVHLDDPNAVAARLLPFLSGGSP